MSHPISLSQKSKSHSIGAVTAASDCTGLQAGNAVHLQYQQPQPSNTLPQYRHVRSIRLNAPALSIHSTKRDKARESHTTERASGGSSHVTSANAELSLLWQQLGPQGRHWLSLQEPSRTDTEAVVARSLLPGLPPLPLFLESDSIQATNIRSLAQPTTTPPTKATGHKHRTQAPDTSTGHKHRTQAPDTSTGHKHRTQAPDTSTGHKHRTQAPDTSTRHKHRTQAPDTSTGHKHRTQVLDTTRVFTVHLYLLPHACTTRVKDDSVGSSHTCGEVI